MVKAPANAAPAGLTGRPSKIIRAAPISGDERHSRSAIFLVIDDISVVEPTAATPRNRQNCA
ncbi:hypothetical protein [Mesorhizobium sp.]|uniref:hypothetical protein n=1 Tax=Mesorhizobium sp. TaxID=1871066 RepID=UPI0025EBDF1F|nr:hypothetical protein [Mesorhizobium sp.]